MVCFVSCICVFVYQTMDAIDGKQARRTGTSGPLGQLFDHGCDAWAQGIFQFLLMQVYHIPPNSLGFYWVPASLYLLFYTLNWEEHHTGILRSTSNLMPVGVTEMQFFTILALLVPVAFPGVLTMRFRDVGALLMPDVTHEHLIDHVFNFTKYAQQF